MAITFQFDLYCIGDRALEGVMTTVVIDNATNKVSSIEYTALMGRNYVEGLGAKGTANHWLNEAKEMLETPHENDTETWYEWEEYTE